MRNRRIHPFLLFAFLAACRAEPDQADPLAGVLTRERAKALAAEQIGKSGGAVKVSTGRLKGVVFTVPAGALSAEAVISIYGAKDVDPDTGFQSVGPAALVKAQGGHLVKDALIELPFSPDAVSGPVAQAVIVLHTTDESLDPLPGVYVDVEGEAVRGPTRSFGTFGAAVDSQYAKPQTYDAGTQRCTQKLGWSTMQSAISRTRVLASGSLNNPAVFTARTLAADGCGYAFNWEVVWYSDTDMRVESYSYAATGATGPLTVDTLTCTAVAFTGTADSSDLSEDFAARLGSTPAKLKVELQNCDTGASPPRIRLTDAATLKSADYGPNGAFLSQTF